MFIVKPGQQIFTCGEVSASRAWRKRQPVGSAKKLRCGLMPVVFARACSACKFRLTLLQFSWPTGCTITCRHQAPESHRVKGSKERAL